ncbi:helix-turn-helix domain-containing protein [Streptomyces sp. NPDC006997]|uniref:helix-turn-helix domain-containing protein n=1 Tax=Streptomyces sp. NPDC006997 TaxID=3155356 RepID=UPI0033C2173D
MPHRTLTQDHVLSLLGLLAEEAAPARFEEVLQRARQDETAEPPGYLDHVGDLALRVRALIGDQRRREAELTALVDAARELSAQGDLAGLLDILTKKARSLLGLSIAYVSLRDGPQASTVRASDGETTASNVGRVTPNRYGIAGLIHQKKTAVWTADYLEDDRFAHDDAIDSFVRTEGLRAVLGVPLRRGDVVFGVLFGADRRVRHFTPGEVSLLFSLADLAAGPIERTQLLAGAHAEVSDLERDRSRFRTALTSLRHMLDVHHRAFDLVLGGCDMRALMTAVSLALDGAVVLRDSGGHTVASSGEIPGLPPAVADTAALEAHTRGEPVRHADNTWTVPLVAADENLGVLTVRPELPLVDDDAPLLRLVAQTITVAVLLQRGAVDGPGKDDLLDDVLAEPAHPHRFAQRARRLAVDPDAPHVLVVARPEGAELGRATVWASSYASRLSGLKTVRDGCVVLLLPGEDAAAAARKVSSALSPLLDRPVSVASAGPAPGTAAVPGLYREAMRTLDALTLLHGPGATAATSDLGFLGLLLSDDHDVDGFVRSTIGRILDYDDNTPGELVKTLQVYFDSGNNQRLAADLLHVHPNTVARRLERVTQLLGDDWQRPHQRLQIQLALLVHRARTALARPSTGRR